MLIFCREKDVINEKISQIIDEDIRRCIPAKLEKSILDVNLHVLNYMLAYNKIFRTIFYFRIQQDEKLSRCFSRLILPPLDNIEIGLKENGYIKGGLKIMHSCGCVIVPYKAGKNLTVFQGVTIGDGLKIGKTGKRNPDIGDNVTIGVGSIVLKDVPDNCIVIGNPAKIIKMNGEVVNIPL